jgi:large subunit ribosomal protein L17
MLHRVKEKKLGRDADHRKALIRNLSTSLVEHKSVNTTLAKAKYVKPFVEKLITKAKKGPDFNTVKYARTKLTTESAVRALFSEVAPLFEKRNGGYTRIVKLPERDGDKAPMAKIEFVVEKPKAPTTKKAVSKKTAKVEKEEVKENAKVEEEVKAEETVSEPETESTEVKAEENLTVEEQPEEKTEEEK